VVVGCVLQTHSATNYNATNPENWFQAIENSLTWIFWVLSFPQTETLAQKSRSPGSLQTVRASGDPSPKLKERVAATLSLSSF
jgi:hypothetical protein